MFSSAVAHSIHTHDAVFIKRHVFTIMAEMLAADEVYQDPHYNNVSLTLEKLTITQF